MSRRILFVDSSKNVGGAEVSLLSLITHLSGTYYPYAVISNNSGFEDRIRANNIPVFMQDFPWLSRKRPWIYTASIFRLVRTIWENRIDLIHTNCDHSLSYVMRASQLTAVPYVSHVRDSVRPWFQKDKVLALNRADRVIVSSNALAKACIDAGVAGVRLTTIYNPVEIDIFLNTSFVMKRRKRSEFNLPQDSVVFGLIGQIQPIKGQKEFVQAALSLSKVLSNVYFLIVGPAYGEPNKTYLAELRKSLQESVYDSRFKILDGFYSDVSALMKAIDVLVVPSMSESFGRVAVEGLAAGCAVIASSAGGLPEIITDGVDGLLFPLGNLDRLYENMLRLSLDTDLRKQLSEAGIVTCKRFDVASHVEQIQKVYDSLLSKQTIH